MNPEFVSKVFELVGKSGDRMIMADPATGKAIVIMDLESYEKMSAGQGVGQQPQVAQAAPVMPETPQMQPVQQQVQPLAQAPQMPVQIDQQMMPQFGAQESKKTANFSQIQQVNPQNNGQGLQDLTQAELLDKINRDIGVWRNAQELNRETELRSAVQQPVQQPAAQQQVVQEVFEEEEQFFLEPIE